MKLSRFNTRQGAVVLLTKYQEIALERAGAWGALGYRFICQEDGKPTFTDAEIATQFEGYQGRTHIGLLHTDYRPTSTPYFVLNPRQYGACSVCAGFADALNCARSVYLCDIVTVRAAEFQAEFYTMADQWRVTLLVV